MPIYEYRCRKCSAVTEKLQGFHDDPLKKCPSCGGRLERMMSAGSFVLKGSGWYATDYGSKSHGGGNGTGKGKAKDKEAPAACPAAAEGSPACAGCPKAE